MILGCYVKVQKRPTNIVVEKLKRLKNTRVNNSESSKTSPKQETPNVILIPIFTLSRQAVLSI